MPNACPKHSKILTFAFILTFFLHTLAVAGEKDKEFLDRFRGVMLGLMYGDAFGAPFEGSKGTKISRQYSDLRDMDRFYPGTHMGIRELGERIGMYTDDTNTALALGEALLRTDGAVDANHVARALVDFADHQPQRGYPDSAIGLKAMATGHS